MIRRNFPSPMLWMVLLLMWLVLNRSLSPAHLLLGAVIATCAVLTLRALQDAPASRARIGPALALLGVVLIDVARSNIAVARIVLNSGTRGRRSGFVDIPLTIRSPGAIAALACIVTATPGTSWAGFDPRTGVMTMHVLDLIDDDVWVRTIRDRYERRLKAVYE